MRQAVSHTTAPVAPPGIPLGRFLDGTPATVRIEHRTLALKILSPGRLVPWMGPAIRGITALRYRVVVCRQPQADWSGRWKHCRGCPHLPSCGYGIAFEPEGPAAHAAATADHDPNESPASVDAIRRVVIAPSFPTAIAAHHGMSLAVRITSVGDAASATIPGIIDALAEAGRRDGLGPDRVRFTVLDTRPRADVLVVEPSRLPAMTTTSPTLPRLTIRLESPLFLRERESRSRRMILDPDFQMFVRHAMRIVREFFPGVRPDPIDAHEHLAATVATVASDIRPFRQEKASRRTFRRFEMEGVVGSITFADVPGCFLPWLALAGILHVGGHRVAGAGGWTVHTEPASPPSPPKPR